MSTPKPTAIEIRAYRDKHECGIEESRAALLKEWRKAELYRLRLRAGELYTVEACRDVIAELLDFLMAEQWGTG